MKFPQIPLRSGGEPLDTLPVHPARPFVPRNLAPRGFQGGRPDELINQAEPFASSAAVTQRRHHAVSPDRRFHPPPLTASGVWLLCSLGHCRACRLLHSRRSASTFLPPFPRVGFTVLPSRRVRLRYYEGSDPCRPHPGRQVSPLTPPCRPGIPSSTTRSAHRSLYQSPQRRRSLPGFATNEQARHGVAPNQVRSSYGLPVHLRLLSTLPHGNAVTFDYWVATNPGADLHRADKASSRTHSFPRKREPSVRSSTYVAPLTFPFNRNRDFLTASKRGNLSLVQALTPARLTSLFNRNRDFLTASEAGTQQQTLCPGSHRT